MVKISDTWQIENLQAVRQEHLQDQPQWLKICGDQEFQKFIQAGYPTRSHENWKYTSLADLHQQTFCLPKRSAQKIVCDQAIEDAYQLTFVDGFFIPALSAIAELSKKIDISSLDQNHQQEFFAEGGNAFTYLNGGLLTDALLLRIKANTQLEKPIHIRYFSTESFDGMMSHTRCKILAEENSRFSVIEEYQGASAITYLNNSVTYLQVKAHAQVNYYKLQKEGEKAFHLANLMVNQSASSKTNFYHFGLGARWSREDIAISFHEPKANARLIGFYQPKHKQFLDYHTRFDHFSSDCTSEQLYKGLLDNHAKAVFNGKIIVHPNAQKSFAKQYNRNLLLSKTSEIYTKPELEIYANDVQCAHGATVSELDGESLFYLRSRGILEEDARSLLKQGFIDEILETIVDLPIKKYITTLI